MLTVMADAGAGTATEMRRRLTATGLLLACAAGLWACAGEPASGPGTAGPSGTPGGAPSSPRSAATASSAPGLDTPAPPSTGSAMSAVTPIFHAAVRPASAPAGEPITLELTVENPGAEPLHVPDPRPGGAFLVLDLTSPSGQRQSITVGPPASGGVRPRLLNVRVLPGQKSVIDFDLGERAPISAPGVYKLSLAYTWKPGEVYRSPELTFTVTAP